jgi:hypothetical protein
VKKHRESKRETFIPLDHAAGQRVEADFGEISVDFPDGRRKVNVLILVWSNRVGQYSRLNELAAVVNAPGNDAFDSGDIVGERRRLAEAYQTFQKATTSAGDDLERNSKSEQSIGLLLRLTKIDAQVALIHKKSYVRQSSGEGDCYESMT